MVSIPPRSLPGIQLLEVVAAHWLLVIIIALEYEEFWRSVNSVFFRPRTNLSFLCVYIYIYTYVTKRQLVKNPSWEVSGNPFPSVAVYHIGP